jgi:hypothetical protein
MKIQFLSSKTASLYVGQRAGVLKGTNRPYDSWHCSFVQANVLESKVYHGSYQSCVCINTIHDNAKKALVDFSNIGLCN